MATSEKTAATPSSPSSSVNTTHRRIRAFFSSIVGIIAIVLIIASILAIWLNRTVTDTNTYANTASQLVNKVDVQEFLVDELRGALLDGKDVPIQELAQKLLTPEQIVGKTNEQLKADVTPIVEDSLRTVVTSPAFATIWKDNNKAIHDQLITQLKSDSPTVKVDFGPVIAGPIDLLGTTKLAFVKDEFALPADAGQTIIKGDQLDDMRNMYGYAQTVTLAVIIGAILVTALCIFIANNRAKTARRIALLTGIFSAILALLLGALALVKPNGDDDNDQKLALAIVDVVIHDLRISLIVIAVLCIGAVVGIKVYNSKFASKKTPAKHD